MCDFPGRLVAWLDGELPEGEAAEVQRHVEELCGMPEPNPAHMNG